MDIDEIYDGWMNWHVLQSYYDGCGFFNVGYWNLTTQTQAQACYQLVDKLFDGITAGSVLDVACGMGGAGRYLLETNQAQDVKGINIALSQLITSRQNVPNIEFIQNDAASLAFAAAQFDIVLCLEAAFHFSTRIDFLNEAYRVLKPGGWLLMTDMIYQHGRPLEDMLVPPANRVPDVSGYQALFDDLPFEMVEIEDVTAQTWNAYCNSLSQWADHAAEQGIISPQERQIVQKNVITTAARHYLLIRARK